MRGLTLQLISSVFLNHAQNYKPSHELAVSILFENDLISSPPGALLVHNPQTYDESLTSCQSLGETILGPRITPDVVHQLRYHAYSQDEAESDHPPFWVRGLLSPRLGCPAWALDDQRLRWIPCRTKLPSLCTHSIRLSIDGDTGRNFTVRSKQGFSFKGYAEKRSFHFLGIPYAHPPTDSLRFKPPVPYDGPRAVNATSRGAGCIQLTLKDDQPPSEPFVPSEDCLTVNVWTSTVSRGLESIVKKPVAVWIHGGAYYAGTASNLRYDGAEFASRGDVVFVSFNYRLGPLGSLATKTMLPGKLATLDQISALCWVQDHIEAFGGDPSRVTIMGQSAGGQSIISLISSPEAKGLFHSAISQSAPLGLPWFTRDLYALQLTPVVAEALGCPSSSTGANEKEVVDCLLSKEAAEFSSRNVVEAVQDSLAKRIGAWDHTSVEVASIEPFIPITENRQPFDLLTSGTLPNPVPLMIGTVRDEAGFYAYPKFPKPLPDGNLTIWKASLKRIFGSELASVIFQSPAFRLEESATDNIRTSLSQIASEYAWKCPIEAFVRSWISSYPHSQTVFQFEFVRGWANSTRYPPECRSDATSPDGQQKICHSEDILPVLGTYRSTNATLSEGDARFVRYVMDTWTAFIYYLDPNPTPRMTSHRGPSYESSSEMALKMPFGPQLPDLSRLHLIDKQPGRGNGGGERCRILETFGFPFSLVSDDL